MSAASIRTPHHVVHNSNTGALECHHCGDVYRVAMPVNVDLLLSLMKTYLTQHRRCLKPKEVSP